MFEKAESVTHDMHFYIVDNNKVLCASRETFQRKEILILSLDLINPSLTLFKYTDTSKARYIKVHLLKKDYFFIHLKIIYQGVLIDFFYESDIHIN